MRKYCVVCLLVFVMLGPVMLANGAEEVRPLPNRQDGIFIARDFHFQSGETLPEMKLAYTTLGTPQRDASGNLTNAVLLLHGTTGTGANYDQIVQNAKRLDANDFLYRWEASADYNPQLELDKIKTRFLAINFSDDLLNPPELKMMEREMDRIKNGRHVMIQAGEKSLGHQNLSQGTLWGPYVAEFLKQLP